MLLSYRIEGYAIASSDGMIADAEGMMPDTLKLEADQRIETLSYTDALTGLPNRRLLADRTEVALAAAKRDT